jgi:hypothetical protein
MDQVTRNLIIHLCSNAGAMMEDASVPAVTARGVTDGGLSSVIGSLIEQVRMISALLVAAAALADGKTA